jgi:hypothetical protein
MNTYRILSWIAALAALAPSAARADRFVAYSMKEAERRLAADPRGSKEAHELGGITHLAGMVYDRQGQDFILVGVARPDAAPLSLDDLVVSLRSMLVHNTPPLVSIDPTPDTVKTRQQSVRFQGGIEQTALGRKMLEADVVLKRLALGRLRAEVWGVHSYFSMLLEQARRGELETRVRSRFWLTNRRPSLAMGKDVFAILEQDIGIQSEVLYAEVNGQPAAVNGAHRDAAGERFSEQVARNFADLSLQYPALAQVRPILAMVSVAEGLRRLGSGEALGYWLGNYRPARVPTPREHELLEEEAEVEGKSQTLAVSGGIEINPIVVRLNAGDVTALRDAVLRSRPSPNALTWQPPLAGWQVPGLEKLVAGPSPTSNADGGFSLDRTLRDTPRPNPSPLPGPLPGTPQLNRSMNNLLRSPEPPRQLQPQFNISRTLPPQRLSPGIGGVMLQGTGRFREGQAEAVDLSRGHFALVVDGQNAQLAPEAFRRFITALWAVYYSQQDPGISIDPIGPGIDQHLVRYIGRVINTDLGRVMRECDYLMKKWAVGTERPEVPGFQSVDDLSARHGLAYVGASRRFWFIPEDMTFRRGGDALLFASGRMTVRTEYTVNGLRGTAAPSDQRFADNFTRLYQQIAQRHPVFQEMFEYAKLVALAKYLKDSGVPLFWFLMANKDLVLTEDSPGTVDALVKGSRHYEGLTIEGGVDLRTQGQYRIDEQAAQALREALARLPAATASHGATALGAAPERTTAEPFSFSLGQADYSVLPQHSLTSGKDRRGLRYQTDFALRGGAGPGLEVVRYFDPRRPEGGDFGQGWRLLIPYRVRPEGAATRPFLNVIIPEKMALENLLTGAREVLTFSTDRYTAAGWVPERLAHSQVIGLFLMSDASFRLADKLGNEFWFDGDGDLTDLVFGEGRRMRIKYAPGIYRADQTPRVASLSQDGYRVDFSWEADRAGRPRIVTAELRQHEDGAPPAYVARYHYDDEGRLAKVESGSAPPVQARAARWTSAGGE